MSLAKSFILILAISSGQLAAQTPAPSSAQELWEFYVELGTGFDPALADLYADDAVIHLTRRYPDGRTRTLQLRGKEYKPLVRQAMPLARNRGDLDVYSNVKFEDLGDRTRITATRYGTLKKYRAPHELIVGNLGGVGWKILKETGESGP
jgi:hypothetical protein